MKNKQNWFERIFIIVSVVNLMVFVVMVLFLKTFVNTTTAKEEALSAMKIQASEASQRATADPFITRGDTQ